MAHKPLHPDNPCHASLPDAEHIPAKIWELLRRNEEFGREVRKLQQLDQTAKFDGQAGLAGKNLVAIILCHHDFAGHALQWLVPEPWFEIHHIAIPEGVDLKGKQYVPIKLVKLESGGTPDPTDVASGTPDPRGDPDCAQDPTDAAKWQIFVAKWRPFAAKWRTFNADGDFDAESRRNHAGFVPMVRGPIVTFTVAEDPRLRVNKVNGIQEWRDYHAVHGPFTLNDPWSAAPPGFKRIFCWLWRLRDSREKNPLTNCRIDAPEAHQTNFFKADWRLFSALLKKDIENEGLVRAIMFDELAENYRVFAFPNSIRTRMEALRLGKWLATQLSCRPDGSKLPEREPEIFGTPTQWDVYLFAGNCNEKQLFEAYKQIEPKLKGAIRRQKWCKARLNYQKHFRNLELEIARIFPVNIPPQ